MRGPWACATVVAAICIASPAIARDCQYEKGEERWAVKNSVPAPQSATQGKPIDLASLIGLKNPVLIKTQIHSIEGELWSGAVAAKDRAGHDVMVREGDIVTVDAYVYRARCQKDGDYHIEIGASKTRSGEMPDR